MMWQSAIDGRVELLQSLLLKECPNLVVKVIFEVMGGDFGRECRFQVSPQAQVHLNFLANISTNLDN